MRKIPILTYHAIKDFATCLDDTYALWPVDFKAQLEHLYELGYKTTIQTDTSEKENTISSIDNRLICLTFDDGYISNFTLAYPVLKKYGFKAIFFIVVNNIDKPGYMSWEQLRQLKADGMAIGSHSMNHPILTKMEDKDVEYELRESKNILDKNLLFSIDSISIPRGFWNDRIANIAFKVGYKQIFTSDEGHSNWNVETCIFKRTVIRKDYTLKDFDKIIRNNVFFFFLKKWERFFRIWLQKILGLGIYEVFKNKWLTFKQAPRK